MRLVVDFLLVCSALATSGEAKAPECTRRNLGMSSALPKARRLGERKSGRLEGRLQACPFADQPGAWPVAVHLTPTQTGIDRHESYCNVALPSASSEYYVHCLAENESANVTISYPEAGAIFTNVAAYDYNGTPINDTDGNFDQLVPSAGQSLSKVWTGPLQLVTRFYKSDWLRTEWASELGWLPTIEIAGKIIPQTCLEQRKKFSKVIGPILEYLVKNNSSPKRTDVSKTMNFVTPNSTGGLYPNPQSTYSYFNPDLQDKKKNKSGVKITMAWPTEQQATNNLLLFGDIMITDMNSTRTDGSLPSDEMGIDGSTPWGADFVLYIYLANQTLPDEVVSAVASKSAHLLRWGEKTDAPGIVYRLVHGNMNGDKNDQINAILTSTDIQIELV